MLNTKNQFFTNNIQAALRFLFQLYSVRHIHTYNEKSKQK